MPISKILLLCVFVLVLLTILVLFLSRDRIQMRRIRRKLDRLRREEANGIPPNSRDYSYRIDFNDVGISVTNLRSPREPIASMLPKHLPGCLAFTDWFSKVAFPAFETNATETFTRETA